MKKYLVIGNPIDHSLSPKLQNHWLKENNINAIYDKIKLEVGEIKNFIHDHSITTNNQLKKHLTRINKLSSNDKNLDILVNLLLINYLKFKH